MCNENSCSYKNDKKSRTQLKRCNPRNREQCRSRSKPSKICGFTKLVSYRHKDSDKHVKYRSYKRGTKWWRHHCRLRHCNPDECSICSNTSCDSLITGCSSNKDCTTRSLISKRIQSRHRKINKDPTFCEKSYTSRCSTRPPTCRTSSQHLPCIIDSLSNVCITKDDILKAVYELTQYLINLYSLPTLLTQMLLNNQIPELKALFPMCVSIFPIVTYLIDNVKYNSMLDVLIISYGVFISTISSKFNNPYGFGAAFIFCTIHFILRKKRKDKRSTKEVFCNLGIIAFCYLCLKVCCHNNAPIEPEPDIENDDFGYNKRYIVVKPTINNIESKKHCAFYVPCTPNTPIKKKTLLFC